MRAQTLLQRIRDILVDARGQDMCTLDVEQFTDITDYMIIVSGTSTRHVLSMADKVIEEMREQGRRPLGLEGREVGEWILIDFGDVVIHLMRPQTRRFYNLEKLWGGAEAPEGAAEV
ncbi:MAG: ribosome silencing factor [Acidiferrobacterales bacterium]